MAIIDDLLTLYHQHFGPQAYSRATHAPVTFTNLPSDTNAQTSDSGEIQVQNRLRNLDLTDEKYRFAPTMQHENTHVLQQRESPVYNLDAVKDRMVKLQSGLSSLGYGPLDLPTTSRAIDEALAFYKSRGEIPGFSPTESKQFVSDVMQGSKAGQLQKFLGLPTPSSNP